MIHAILLKYPRARSSLNAMSINLIQNNEEEICDYAMLALKTSSLNNNNGNSGNDVQEENDDLFLNNQNNTDFSWLFSLLRHHYDNKIKKIIDIVVSKDLVLLPLRITDVQGDMELQANDSKNALQILDSLEKSFEILPKSLYELKNKNTKISVNVKKDLNHDTKQNKKIKKNNNNNKIISADKKNSKKK